ncbi:general secretion pathway protein GspK [Thermodesulfobacteriota bacterium]
MKIAKNNRGMALMITIAIIALLVTVALELNRNARATVATAAATRNSITLSQMATSGIHIAMAVLVKDKTESKIDSIQEDWADPKKMAEIFQDIPFEAGRLTVKISDELSRIQVNAIVEFPDRKKGNDRQMFLWDRFLTLFTLEDEYLEENAPRSIVTSLKDWIDAGEDDAITGLAGAESDYYESLDSPYSCRNGPIPHAGELVLIKGITPELFYGNEERTGISQYVTAEGMTRAGKNRSAFEGKININTAEIPVLSALLPLKNAALAQLIHDYRVEKSESVYLHDLTGPEWYKNIPGLSDIEIDPELISTSSDIFRIESIATHHQMKRIVTSVVQREVNKKTGQWKCKVLRWKID